MVTWHFISVSALYFWKILWACRGSYFFTGHSKGWTTTGIAIALSVAAAHGEGGSEDDGSQSGATHG